MRGPHVEEAYQKRRDAERIFSKFGDINAQWAMRDYIQAAKNMDRMDAWQDRSRYIDRNVGVR